MERKIGEIFFNIDGQEMIVVKSNDGCTNCDFCDRLGHRKCWDNKEFLGNCVGISFKVRNSFKFLK